MKTVFTFSTGYNGIFKVTNSNNKFLFAKLINMYGFFQVTIPQRAYEIESLFNEIKRVIIEEGQFTEADSPFTTKQNISTLGFIFKISRQEPLFNFLPDDSIRDLLGFDALTLYEEYNLSLNSINNSPFDYIFNETDITQGKIFRWKMSGINHYMTMDVSPRYKYIQKTRGGVHWYLMGNKNFLSSISCKLKSEENQIVSINGQSITLRLSTEEI